MNKTEQKNRKWIDQFIIKIQYRSFILKIIGLSLVIIFWNLLFSIYSTLIIEPILSKYKAHWTIDLTVLSCCSLIAFFIIHNVRKKEYKILSSNLLFLLSAICIIYSIVRSSNTGLKYDSFYYLRSINVADFIFGFISIIIATSLYLQSKPCKNKISFNNSEEDEKEKLEDDILFRKYYAEQLAAFIQKKANQKNSYAIGVRGKWGEGKTTFINFTKRYLEQSNNCVIIDFCPWYSTNPKALIYDFFATLEKELKKHNPNIGSSFKSYAQLLMKYYDKNNALETILDNITNTPITLKDKFEKVKSDIISINKQIIICIDDIDRLDNEEIIEIIRLIRNTANFSNTIFIVMYDENYVYSALKKLSDYGYDTYLEKIIQVEVTLPAFDKTILKDKFIELASKQLDKSDSNLLKETINQPFFNTIFDYSFNNIRDLHRFIDSFCIFYSTVKGDVLINEFLYLHVLYYKHLEIYQLIQKDLFKSNQEFFNRHYLNHTNVITLSTDGDPIAEIKSTKTNIQDHLTKIKVNEYNIENIMSILNYLFPYSIESQSEQRFRNNYRSIFQSINYKKYFAFRNLETNISHAELKEQFAKTQVELNQQITQWISEGKYETLDVYFKSFDKFKSKEEYEQIIQSMFFFANQMNPEKDRVIDFNDNITRKWISYKTTKGFYKDENAHRLFILQVFEEADTPALFPSGFLARQLGDWDRKNEDYGEMPFTKEEAIDFNMKYLEKYTSNLISFTNKARSLYDNCDLSRPENLEKANSLIIQLAKQDLKNFFSLMIIQQPTLNQNVYILNNYHYKRLFGTIEKFEDFLAEVKNDSEYYKEFMTFYELTKHHGYSEMSFDFKHLKESKIEEIEIDPIKIDPQYLQDQLQKTQS